MVSVLQTSSLNEYPKYDLQSLGSQFGTIFLCSYPLYPVLSWHTSKQSDLQKLWIHYPTKYLKETGHLCTVSNKLSPLDWVFWAIYSCPHTYVFWLERKLHHNLLVTLFAFVPRLLHILFQSNCWTWGK